MRDEVSFTVLRFGVAGLHVARGQHYSYLYRAGIYGDLGASIVVLQMHTRLALVVIWGLAVR